MVVVVSAFVAEPLIPSIPTLEEKTAFEVDAGPTIDEEGVPVADTMVPPPLLKLQSLLGLPNPFSSGGPCIHLIVHRSSNVVTLAYSLVLTVLLFNNVLTYFFYLHGFINVY